MNSPRAALVGAVACIAMLVAPSFAVADPSSLYQGPGPRPGPDILYESPANAPQLQNTGNWGAGPILVSGSTAYRGGEFLYQDWLYDDSGALGNQVSNDPRQDGDGFSRWAGTYLYPTNPAVYGNNAADLVELRVEPLATSTAFRVTLNTIKDSSVVGATIAIGGTVGTLRAWPYSANVRSPAQYFLTVHGTTTPGQVTADLRDAATGLVVAGAAPSASLDMTRRQVTVTVPHSTYNPGTSVVRMAAGVGLWNAATSLYRVPTQNPSATLPGGAQLLGSPPAFFNLAFRDECQQEDPIPPGMVPAGCEPMPNVQHPNALGDPSWWREHAQAHVLGSGTALATPDISPFFANVDFSKLAGQVSDETNVPQTGQMNRIFASHIETEQGAVYTQDCNTSTTTSANTCLGWLRGQLQPYSIYVPTQPQPSGGYGLTLLLHSLQANYNQFMGSANQSQFGERGPGSIVITASGRGPDGWYYGSAASDTFEMWADVAQNYTLDPEWSVISGYSMGGYATYKLGAQFPDLFAKGQPVVGPPGQGIWAPPAPPQPGGDRSNTNRMLASFRNVPFLIWNGTQDELVSVASAQAQAAEFGALGLRYEWDLFTTSDHFGLALNDEYGEAATFLGTTEVDRNPPHVTYVYNPTMDFATGQLNANHAYWLSAVTLRNGAGTAPLGTIDVLSQGFGVGDPTPSGVTNGAGVLVGGQSPMPYSCESQSWGPSAPTGTCEAGTAAGPTTPFRDELDINATNISSVTVNARRARVTCDAQKNIISDSGAPPPVTVNLVDCPDVPTLSIANESQAEGDAGTANRSFTVTLTGNTDNLPVSFHYQTANGTASSTSDYNSVSGDLSFGLGETTKVIDVPINGDTTYENDETFSVELSDVEFATPSSTDATGTITNDDAAPTLSISDESQAEGDAGSANQTFTVTKSGTTDVPVTVHYQTVDGSAVDTSDYNAASGDLTFDPNETTETIDVPINGDTTYENDEDYTVHLSAAVDATISDADGTGTITNDDSAPTLSISDESQAEGDAGSANQTFTVTKSGTTDVPVTVHYQTVDGSAVDTSDYNAASGDLTFDPNETTETIDVPINGDTTYENDEDYTVHLSAAVDATISDADGTGTITNDDPQPGYARPKSASPSTFRLVPSHQSCADPNGSHGAPLDSPSCSPSIPTSDFLTVGTPEGNGQPSKFAGSLKLKVVGESPIDPDNGDQANVEITMGLNDVRNAGDLSEYTGELRTVLDLRITDRYNGAALDSPATVTDASLAFTISCATTPGPEGGDCNVATTIEALTMAGMAREGKRAIWELLELQVFDGGEDGDADSGANTVFAVPGLFAP